MMNADDLLKLGSQIRQRTQDILRFIRSDHFCQYPVKDRLAIVFEASQSIQLLQLIFQSPPFSKFSEDDIHTLIRFNLEDWSSVEHGKFIYEKIQLMPNAIFCAGETPIHSICQFLDSRGLSTLTAKIEWPILVKLTKQPTPEIQQEMFASIRSYLANYWQCQKTGCFSYTATPLSRITNYHTKLASFLYVASITDPTLHHLTEDERNHLSLMTYLMPGVSTESVVDGYDELAPKDIQSMSKLLMTHIVSQNGLYLIPVCIIRSLLTHQKEAHDDLEPHPKRALLSPPTDPTVPLEALDIGDIERIPNPYYDYKHDSADNPPYLTLAERSRLKTFSKQTTELFILHEQYLEIISRKTHLLGQCRILAERLLQNGKNGNGTINEAGAGAEAAIHAFLDFYEKLTVDETTLPPLLIKEVMFLRQCVRRCHPDVPVMSYAETCTDAAYQRMLIAISGHETTLANIVLDDTSEDYLEILTNTKTQLVERIREFTPEPTESKSVSYDQIMVDAWNILDALEKFKRISSHPEQSNPVLIQKFIEKLFMPKKDLDVLINSLLRFTETELQKLIENTTTSRGVAYLIEHSIGTTDDWLRLLTYLSPKKIQVLHSPSVIKQILHNIQSTSSIPIRNAIRILLNSLVTIKKNVLFAAIKSVHTSLILEIPDEEAYLVFYQSEVEILNQVLSLLPAPGSEEYQLLQAKIKSLCDTPDFARVAKFTLREITLLKSVLDQYGEPFRLLNELKPYLETIRIRELANLCIIFLRFDMSNLVSHFFNQSILKNALSIPPATYPSKLRQSFYQFLDTVKSLSDETLAKKFVSVLQQTVPTWLRYVSTPAEAIAIKNIFPQQREILSATLDGKFEAVLPHNTWQINRLLNHYSDAERALYFDRYREKIIKIIKSAPDFINIYKAVSNDPMRCNDLFETFMDKFCTITQSYKHIRWMAENLNLGHFKEYLHQLTPHFIEKMLRINIHGIQKNPLYKNIILLMKDLEDEQQRVVVQFLFHETPIREHIKIHFSESREAEKEINKILKQEAQSLFESLVLSLRATIATPFSFFGAGAASAFPKANAQRTTTVSEHVMEH